MNNPTVNSSTLAERLTLLPALFEGHPLSPGGHYIVNNDRRFGHAARVVSRSLPDTKEDTPVYMTVGNGGFESISALLPPEVAILHVDKDPRVLMANRVARQIICGSETREDFLGQLGVAAESTRDSSFNAEIWRRAYSYQADRWRAGGLLFPMLSVHFLASERRFRKVRDSLMQRQIGYFTMDLFSADHRRVLAERLSSVSAKIVAANFTNVFDVHYNQKNVQPDAVAGDLPMHESALIIQSSGRKYRSLVARSGFVYQFDGNAARIDPAVSRVRLTD